ncbi:MAG: hypothetical protein ACRELY_29625 [Polyangiaceae bacterium]
MRYLYGDSAPFPHSYNFLSTLESFVGAAARIVKLDSESRALEITTAQQASARVQALDDLEAFHGTTMRMVADSAGRSAQPGTVDYARQVMDHAGRIVEEAKRGVQATNDRDQGMVRAEVERRRLEIRSALEGFLTQGHLPALGVKVSAQLVDMQYTMSATFTNPDGVVSSFRLGASRVAVWSQPRKVSEFSDGMNLMVGIKKGLFRKGTQPEALQLDEYILSGFELSDSSAQITLRRKIQERDSLVFDVKKEDEVIAEVTHPLEDGEGGLPTTVDAGDRLHLTRLWQAVGSSLEQVLQQKDRLAKLTLNGEDVFENDLSIQFVAQLVTYLASTVLEIAKRSPNPSELSLKKEDEQGRREEIYVKREDLMRLLAPLGEKERAIFAPFGFGPVPAELARPITLDVEPTTDEG